MKSVAVMILSAAVGHGVAMKAGVAKQDLVQLSDRSSVPMWAKALALESGAGRRIVIVTTDAVRIPRDVADEVALRVRQRHGLERRQLLLSASHTKTGPPAHSTLAEALLGAIGAALKDMAPANVFYAEGARVLKVTDRAGSTRAVLFAPAMFLMLGGGDQDPVLSGPMTPVSGPIQPAFRMVQLRLAPRSRQDLRLIDEVDCPVQAVRFGHSLTLLSLGGEVSVEYALRVQREYRGEPVITAGRAPVGPSPADVEERVFAGIHQVMANVGRKESR